MKSPQRLNKRDHRVLGGYRSALTVLGEAASTLPGLLVIHDVGGQVIVVGLSRVIVILLFAMNIFVRFGLLIGNARSEHPIASVRSPSQNFNKAPPYGSDGT